jgi:hypothetical protein
VLDMKSELSTWRMHWICRALFRVPGRLTRSGRQVTLRVPPQSRCMTCSVDAENN